MPLGQGGMLIVTGLQTSPPAKSPVLKVQEKLSSWPDSTTPLPQSAPPDEPSFRQLAPQPSSAVIFPSSQLSPSSTVPLPQTETLGAEPGRGDRDSTKQISEHPSLLLVFPSSQLSPCSILPLPQRESYLAFEPSKRQFLEQPSPSVVFLSSHSSVDSTTPLPQEARLVLPRLWQVLSQVSAGGGGGTPLLS